MRRGPHIWLLMLALCCAFSATSLSTASAKPQPVPATTPVPPGFVGMMVDGPLFPITDPTINLAQQLKSMVASGVQSLRLSFEWALTQPYASWQDVPAADRGEFEDVGGIPTNFGPLDQIVGLAAADGLTVLPVVLDAPGWDGIRTSSSLVAIPRSDAPYANFVKALVRRYGPHGSFWADHSPRLPIRMWQIWNEMNVTAFWSKQPFVNGYVSLLRAARSAIKSVDPGAKIVLGGMPNFSWIQLGKIYKVRGARRLFDVVAIHPYTRQPQGVITILTKARAVMNAAGDARKPILADEVSWPSSQGKTDHNVGLGFDTTEAGQARNLGILLPQLGKDRVSLGLLGFYYDTWAGDETHNGLAFDFAGLFRFNSGRFITKPAFGVFRRDALALEKCRQKASVATRCLKPA